MRLSIRQDIREQRLQETFGSCVNACPVNSVRRYWFPPITSIVIEVIARGATKFRSEIRRLLEHPVAPAGRVGQLCRR
jgi:hypothetical protein